MQSTKPTQFIVRFKITKSIDEEKRHAIEGIRHVNQTTNEILSAKCYTIWNDWRHVFLHSHPIVADGQEHEGNILLINKIMETAPWDKFVYNTNRHIKITRKVFFGDRG